MLPPRCGNAKRMRTRMINEREEEIRAAAHNKSKTLAIDFDGVIHSYKQGWTGEIPEDEPMPGVESALQKLYDDGWELIVFSTRNEDHIWDWLDKYGLHHFFTDVTNTKIPAKLYIDDRGYHFENWEDTIEFVKTFKDRYDQ